MYNTKDLIIPKSLICKAVRSFQIVDKKLDGFSIDPGFQNPLACLWFARDNEDNIYVFDEHYEAYKDIECHSKIIKAKSKYWGLDKDEQGYYEGIIDPAANLSSFDYVKSVRDLFYQNKIKLIFGKKDIFSFINNLTKLLLDKKIFIHPRCSHLINELNFWEWNSSGEYPIKKNDHCIDALQFYIQTRNSGSTKWILGK